MMSRPLVGGIACIFLALGGSGCALRDGDVALDGTLRIELSPPKGPVFYGVQVSQRDGELLVSGFGRRPRPQGHVEAVLIGPDGTTLAEARAELLPPRAVPKRTSNYRFQVALPIVPPAGSTLRVTYTNNSPPNPRDDHGAGREERNRHHAAQREIDATERPAATSRWAPHPDSLRYVRSREVEKEPWSETAQQSEPEKESRA